MLKLAASAVVLNSTSLQEQDINKLGDIHSWPALPTHRSFFLFSAELVAVLSWHHIVSSQTVSHAAQVIATVQRMLVCCSA